MTYKHILGINARNHLYQARYNRKQYKRRADSKIITKTILKKVGIRRPLLYKVFRRYEEVIEYDWNRLPASFVIKPNKGFGGEGVVVIDKGGRFAGEWLDINGREWKVRDFQLQIGDIVSGLYSVHNVPDYAFIEEKVPVHPKFVKYSYHGTPDIRVIVFERVPVMAMLRLATKESGGRANLHQGAVGVGVDVASGVTTHAIHHGREIVFLPRSRRKLHGLRVPDWEQILLTAVKAQIASQLGYVGVDIILHPKKGPMVLEINSKPGLQIQLANQMPLRRRLERVEGLRVTSAQKGVVIGRELFAHPIAEKVVIEPVKVGVFEEVEVVTGMGEKVVVRAKVDTGAFRTSIDKKLAQDLGLTTIDNILFTRNYGSALGRDVRMVVGITYYLQGKKIRSSASVSDRGSMKRLMIIGRRDLKGFLVAPGGVI